MMKISTLLMAQITMVPLLPFLVWRLPFTKIWMPLGVVQIVTGFALGPAILGAINYDVFAAMYPAPVRSAIDGIGWFAIVLFVASTATHWRARDAAQDRIKICTVSCASLLLPLLAGAGLGFVLASAFPELVGSRSTTASFAAGIGICTAVTALPILNLIVRDLGIATTKLGQLAMAVAFFDDALLWVLLAAVTASVQPGGAPVATVARIVLLSAISFGVIRWVMQPLLERLDRAGAFGNDGAALVGFAAVCGVSALVADTIGLHPVIGAFVAGLVLPRGLAARALPIIEPMTWYLLLPFFFLASSLKAASGAGGWLILTVFFAATLVAMAGKFVGTALAARAYGESWRDALALGALVQAKGLIEIVALRVLVDANIINAACFLAFVMMALCTTVIAKPLASACLGRSGAGREARNGLRP